MTRSGQIDDLMPPGAADRHQVRTAVRFPMKLPLTIHSEVGVFVAVTENVSSNGLLFVSDFLPDVNAKIEFTMKMPAAIMGSSSDVLIHCTGRIVRHEHESKVKKAAVVIDEYYLRA
jgi:hypothetical protein